MSVSRLISLLQALYRFMLLAFPTEFRTEFGEEMGALLLPLLSVPVQLLSQSLSSWRDSKESEPRDLS